MGTLYKTNENGENYEIIEEFDFIKDLVLHPENNNILFVCDESGLYKIDISENNIETLLNGDFEN